MTEKETLRNQPKLYEIKKQKNFMKILWLRAFVSVLVKTSINVERVPMSIMYYLNLLFKRQKFIHCLTKTPYFFTF